MSASSKRIRACVVPSDCIGPSGVWRPLPEDAVRYFIHVLRLTAGRQVELRDVEGMRQIATLSRDEEGRWGVEAQEPPCRVDRPPGREVWLAPALIKAQRFTWLLEKSAELGADQIHPLSAKRGVVRWSSEQFEGKRGRLERILSSGARQSDAHTPPRLEELAGVVEQAVRLRAQGARLLYASPGAETSLRAAIEGASIVAIFTGPEGGFTPAETDGLDAQGAVAVSLGPRILRAETAPIAALAAIRLLDDA